MTTTPKTTSALADFLGGLRGSIPAWTADAMCAQTDPEAFFPDKGQSPRAAQAVCARCPVAAECLDYALEIGDRFGIWGGVTAKRRRNLTPSTASPVAVHEGDAA